MPDKTVSDDEFAVMDDNGIIETDSSLEYLIESEDRIREDNENIKGDLLFI